MKEAADAGKRIIDQTTKRGGISRFDEENTAEDINKITEANKQALIESGNGFDASYLGQVSNDELELLAKEGKDELGGISSAKEADDMLAGLEKDEARAQEKGESLDEKSSKKLNLLRTVQKMGGFTSNKAFADITSGKRDRIAMGSLEASKAIQNKVAFDTQKKNIDEKLSTDIDKYENRKDTTSEQKAAVAEARKTYTTKDGKLDFDKMRKDQESGAGIFKDKKKFEGLGSLLQGSSQAINTAKEQTVAQTETADPMKQALDALKDLIGLIKSGGGIGDKLGELAKALTGIH
jgi:hypothetical protein